MAFHAGVLQFLAENEALERVIRISSVSGGSLFVGLLLHLNGMRWPSSKEYLELLLPQLREKLVTTDLGMVALGQMARPSNWKFVLSRANILASAIGRAWGIDATLDDLPVTPIWSINATTAETGKRFRFKGGELRDWVLGTANVKDFPLCDAMAVSAAFPGLIGPYVLKSNTYQWELPVYSATKNIHLANEIFEKIHLYDGGIYDNLGLEAFFDAGQGLKPDMLGTIVTSDAGAPLASGFDLGRLSIFRLKRVTDIMSDQVRSLRVRGLVAYALKEPGSAAYLRIGATAEELAHQFKIIVPPGAWMTKERVVAAATVPTGLMQLTSEAFDLLQSHGFESASLGDIVFCYL